MSALVTCVAIVACGSSASTTEDPEGGAPEAGTTESDGASSTEDAVVLFDAGAPCDGSPCDRRIAFITQNLYPGNFGGIANADQACMTEAQANPLLAGRTFRAWLSTNGIPARTRFPSFTGSLRRVDGEIVAASLSELLTTGPRVPINRPPDGASAPSSLVWTGTSSDGAAIADKNCMGWAAGGTITAGVGKSDDLAAWTSSTPDRPCAVPLRLYCFEN